MRKGHPAGIMRAAAAGWLLFTFIAAACLPGASRADAAPGLKVSDGMLTMDGHPVRRMGVNYFDAFARVLDDEAKAAEYRAGFRKLKEHGIPFIRFNCGGFYPTNWEIHQKDPERYFRLLDRFVADAEESGIGLIPSFFWFFLTPPGISGEPLDAWGDEGSRTHAWMKKYVSEVVGRYHRSPAILAWEFGNEYNLAMDLPGGAANHKRWFHPSRGFPDAPRARDALRAADVGIALKVFGEAVRKSDPDRPIISGHAMPRSAAAHLERDGTWTADKEPEWTDALLRSHPSPIDTLSVHYYPFHKDDGTGITGKTHVEQLEVCLRASHASGKPLFVGEFGPAPDTDPATRLKETAAMIDEMVSLKVPLSAVWVFDFPHQDVSIPADGSGDAILRLVQAANERMK
ncbi:MAG: cellulase family glycosylhydrolase [Akkermansiaceae bacterium]|nr:cellulase family glycosylhydrolase [Akkermansiaceae bacterium]